MVQPLAVLFIAANPGGTDPLRLDRELRVIQEAIRFSRLRQQFDVQLRVAATVHDLRRALLDRQYDVVHVSAHGEQEGLILEDESGAAVQIPRQALAGLFALHTEPRGSLKCVVLNACWSMSTGIPTAMRVPVTIAMEGPISDRGAIEFSRGFYDGLGAGLSFTEAYQQGRSCVALAAPGSAFQSVLLQNEDHGWPNSAAQSIVPSLSSLGPICPICGVEEEASSTLMICSNCGETRESFSASAYGRTQLHIRFDPLDYSPRAAATLIEEVSERSLLGVTGFVESGRIQFRTRVLKCRPQMAAAELRRGSEPIVGISVKWSYSTDLASAECDINWFSGIARFIARANDVGLHSEFFGAIEPHLPRDSFAAWGIDRSS